MRQILVQGNSIRLVVEVKRSQGSGAQAGAQPAGDEAAWSALLQKRLGITTPAGLFLPFGIVRAKPPETEDELNDLLRQLHPFLDRFVAIV